MNGITLQFDYGLNFLVQNYKWIQLEPDSTA